MKLIMWNLITLDGYFEGARPWDLDFHQLAWGQELEDFIAKQIKTVDLLVFGAATYQGMANYWSSVKAEAAEYEVAEYMNKLPKIVCSRQLESADWQNTTIARDAVAEISKLKQTGSGNMFVFGSGNLSAALMQANLFDEYRLCLVPVFLGAGKRLFEQGLPYQQLQLLEARPLQTGAIILRYSNS